MKAKGFTVKLNAVLVILCLVFSTSAKNAQAQTLSNVQPISFGEMVVGGSGDVTIPSSSDTRSATGMVALVGAPFAQRASVDVTFTPGAQITISFPPSIPMTGGNNPNLDITLDGMAIQTIPPGGTLTLYFGGTLTFVTSGSNGIASAVIPVTVDPL